MSRVDRIEAVLALLAVMDGGVPPDPSRLDGLSGDELHAAELLYAAGLDADRPARARRAAALAYLVEHAPGAPSIEAAIAQLGDTQLKEFLALGEGL